MRRALLIRFTEYGPKGNARTAGDVVVSEGGRERWLECIAIGAGAAAQAHIRSKLSEEVGEKDSRPAEDAVLHRHVTRQWFA